MPELPEVETARSALEHAALGRRIVEVDDSDRYTCRPHPDGEIRAALLGRELTGAFRRGKSLWCTTSGIGEGTTPGPVLGLHLGMSGHLLISDPAGVVTDGGDWMNGRYAKAEATGKDLTRWDRFGLRFADGGALRFFDPRRLGRVRLDPNVDALGPDAATVSAQEFVTRIARSKAPVKARLLDQSVIAGVGNLLADEIFWQARIAPTRPADELSSTELTTLHRAVHTTVAAAIEHGGSHTGTFIEFRGPARRCPRCGAELARATVGGRTTWWCPVDQG